IAAVQQGLVTHYGRLLASKQVSAKNRRGDTALHWAAFRGDLTAVEALHKADPDLDAVGDLGNRPLHLAVSQGHWAVTRYLLGHGANMTCRNSYRCTPSMLCQDAAVKELLVDVAKNGASARAEFVRQMEDEAAEAAAADAARRLLEQRLLQEAAQAEAAAKKLAEEEAEAARRKEEEEAREAARLENLRLEQEARAKAQEEFRQREEEAAEAARLEAEAAAAAKKKGKKGAAGAAGGKSTPRAAAAAAAKASPASTTLKAKTADGKARSSASGTRSSATPRPASSRLAQASSAAAAPSAADAANPVATVAGAAEGEPFAEDADLQKQALVNAATAQVDSIAAPSPSARSPSRTPSAKQPLAATISVSAAPRRSSSTLSDRGALPRASRASEAALVRLNGGTSGP
ncbi:hypothetical protein WJX73_008667, partial [Symbiochloris irregularis]